MNLQRSRFRTHFHKQMAKYKRQYLWKSPDNSPSNRQPDFYGFPSSSNPIAMHTFMYFFMYRWGHALNPCRPTNGTLHLRVWPLCCDEECRKIQWSCAWSGYPDMRICAYEVLLAWKEVRRIWFRSIWIYRRGKDVKKSIILLK